jgi:hypothetical protein
MVKKKTKDEIISLIEKRGAMGLLVETLGDHSIPRTKVNYERIKGNLLSLPTGLVESDVFKNHLTSVLGEEELILVGFQKEKANGKIGHRKEFEEGFFYYIGEDETDLKKMYLHWGEEKKFLLENIDCLESDLFQIETNINDHVPKTFCIDILLYKVQKSNQTEEVQQDEKIDQTEKSDQTEEAQKEKILQAEISLYIGYNTPGRLN